MNTELLKETIKRELPALLREDPALRAYILEPTRQEYASRAETQDRFFEILAELRRDREAQTRKWEEQNRKWDKSGQRFDRLHEEIMAQAQKVDRSIGALGDAKRGGISQCTSRDPGKELRCPGAKRQRV